MSYQLRFFFNVNIQRNLKVAECVIYRKFTKQLNEQSYVCHII